MNQSNQPPGNGTRENARAPHQEGQLEEAKVELESAVQLVPDPADLHELLRLGAVILQFWTNPWVELMVNA